MNHDPALRDQLFAQLPFCIDQVIFPGSVKRYEGKVRDCYLLGTKRILITSDRLSAFDVVLTTIPFKGELLNSIADFWFQATAEIIPNHVISRPHPNIFVAREVEIIPIEVVVRGYLCGSAWRDYVAGRTVSGIKLPADLKEFSQFQTPIITPSTKAEKGLHDLPISEQEIIDRGIVPTGTWEKLRYAALSLFHRGQKIADDAGLILVDTKYEFGLDPKSGELVLADEIHTQDSSRYWLKESYLGAGTVPKMLDKEFFRRYLLERGYSGNGEPPIIPDDVRVEVALTYIETFEKITGKQFKPEVGEKLGKIAAILPSLCL